MSKENEVPLFREQVSLERIQILAESISKQYNKFEKEKFLKSIKENIYQLGLKERTLLVTEHLRKHLPDDFLKAITIIVKSLEKELPSDIDDILGGKSEGSIGFVNSSLTLFVSMYGEDYFEESMEALYEMTKRFTSEWAIRTFLIKYEKKTLKQMRIWAKDENVHVRRLVSEGTRPRIPWGIKLQSFIDDPTDVISILNILKSDPCLYVRRSVANNLNDISKDHPQAVIITLNKWKKSKNKEMSWLISHALRTLIKKGNSEALELIGYSKDIKLKTIDLKIYNSSVVLGESLNFSLHISSKSKEDQKLLIDFIIYHRKSNGKLSPKVFKLTRKILKGNVDLLIKKKHLIKEISTRKYYSGEHEIHIQINGQIVASDKFELYI